MFCYLLGVQASTAGFP